jgi:hypothetical protein
MPEPRIEPLDAEALRALVRQRLQARTHWMILLSEDERHHLDAILDALDAQPLEGVARVCVDLWGIRLATVNADDGTETDLGRVLFISSPRLAMPIEHLHALVSRLFGTTMPIARLLERPIIVPVNRAHLRRTGDQLNVLQNWFHV